MHTACLDVDVSSSFSQKFYNVQMTSVTGPVEQRHALHLTQH